MATLPELLPNGTGTVVSGTWDSTSSALVSDNDDGTTTNTGYDTNSTIRYPLTDMPLDLESIDNGSITITVRCRMNNVGGDDTWNVQCVITTSTGTLMLTDATALQSVTLDQTMRNYTWTGLSIAPGSNNRTALNDAHIEIRVTRNQNMGNDSNLLRVARVGVTGTYTPASGDKTVTPAVIAAAVATPAATASVSKTVSPGVIACTTALPQATNPVVVQPVTITAIAGVTAAERIDASESTEPVFIASVVAFPLATVSTETSATKTPATIAALAALPAATRQAGATRSPAVTAVTTTLPASTRSISVTRTPVTIAVTVAMSAVTITLHVIRTPVAVALVVSIPASTQTLTAARAPPTIAAVVAAPAATARGSVDTAPATIAVVVALPLLFVDYDDPATLTLTQQGADVLVEWTAPGMAGATHVAIFRRTGTSTADFDPDVDVEIGRVAIGTLQYLDQNVASGDYAYQVFPVQVT